MVSAIENRSTPRSRAAAAMSRTRCGGVGPSNGQSQAVATMTSTVTSLCVGDRDDLVDLIGGLCAAAPDVGLAECVAGRAPRTRSSAAPRRRPAWRHWGWPPTRRTRCRGSCAARLQVRRRRPSTAPSTGTRTRWPPLRVPRSRPPQPAVPAWPTTGLVIRSAIRRAAPPRGCRHVSSQNLLGAQLLELLGGLAEQPDVNVVVVLSRVCRAGVANPARRFREHRDDPGPQHRPRESLVVMLD